MATGIATMDLSGARGIRFTMSVPGAKKVDVALARFAEGISDFIPFWRDHVAPLFFDRAQRNFETQGGFAGGWAPLSPAYAAWKAQHYGSKPILQREGSLVQSLTWNNGQVGPKGIARFEKTRAELGTSVTYALAHQDPRAGSHLPKRQIIVLPGSDTMGRLLHKFLWAQAKQAGLAKPAETN
jgi:phage gpG-like protein